MEEYSLFVSTYRDKVTKVGPNQAADEALAALPDGRVKKYLYSQKGEVIDMLLTEYDEQAVMQAIAKEAEAKGEKRGISIGETRGIAIGEKAGEMRGIAIGEKTGESRGESKLCALISAMTHAGEGLDAVERISSDPEYRKKMYLKYMAT